MDEVVELNGTMKEIEEEQHKKKNDNDDRSAEEVVQWEKFLPRMVLTVLLVESDHSTRQIITALLKKCGYRVIAVPDGLKAWEMLKRKAPDLDLILTEVELPAISGFALLSLIMEHDICKNIPVIMMSSHDSVSMVLKCMLKGAVDFLIKPVRRNELRNLWQHVWRRHAITRPPQNNDKKLETAIEDNSASHQSSGSVPSPQKNNEGSGKYSEAQSTCTSPFLEAESAHMENMQNASQLINSSKLSNIDTVKHEEFTKFKRESTKHNYETGEKSITCASEAARCDKTFKLTGLRLEQGHGSAEIENKDDNFRAELSTGNPNINTEIHGCSHELEQPSAGAFNLISTYENPRKHNNENCCLEGGNITEFDFDRQLDLSSKKDFPASSCKQASEAAEEWQRLNHSNTSAFSWYNGSKLWQPHFSTTQNTSSKVNNDNWDSHESHKLSGIIAGNNLSNQNQENMTTTNVFTLFHAQSVVHPIWNPKPVCQNESSPFPSSTSSHSNPESRNSDQHNHWSDDANYTCLSQNVNGKINLDHARHDCPVAGKSANDLCHDVTNHINSSAYGSTDSGKDGNATSTMIAKNTPESFSDSGYHNYDGFRLMDSHRSSQREAALTKFRLKRKERCYEKKVRYQSRKRLAEQRPRVKGQFVRQVQTVLSHEDASEDACHDRDRERMAREKKGFATERAKYGVATNIYFFMGKHRKNPKIWSAKKII